MLDINNYLLEKKEEIIYRLKEHIHKEDCPGVLYDSAHYFLGTGKLLRPLFIYILMKNFSISEEKAIDPACSLELIHTYSLIHDDLPCMDNDDFRRKKPSLHKKFSEAVAVLTGDFLLTLSFEILAKSSLNDEEVRKLTFAFSKRAGGFGMIGGQILDIESDLSKAKIQTIHYKKTASLFILCGEIFSILSELPKTITGPIIEYAENIGLAYQFLDDLQDMDESKTTSSSLDPVATEKQYKQYFQNALNILEKIPYDTTLLNTFTKRILQL